MQKIFRMPPTVITGAGSAGHAGSEIKKMGAKKALIITDKVIVEIGALKSIEDSLKENGISYSVFDDIPTEPTVEYVDKGIKAYRNDKCDCLLAIGGGSAIDTAKAISVMLTNEGEISDYMGLDKIKNSGVPLIAVPTTAGTGSEVTIFTIITDTHNDVKMLIGGGLLMPQVAIADPLLTISMPPALTAATGMDALCHAIEAYVSLKANPLSDIFALSAIELLSDFLRAAWANGNNLEAREKVMIASLKAGVAFTNSSVTLVHGMSRPIGANFHVPHGLSNAVLLTTVMEYSLMANPERYAKISETMGFNTYGLNVLEAAKLSVDAVKDLVRDIKIPSMQELGIEESRLIEKAPKMAEAAIKSGSPGNNPRQVTKEDIINLYKAAYSS